MVYLVQCVMSCIVLMAGWLAWLWRISPTSSETPLRFSFSANFSNEAELKSYEAWCASPESFITPFYHAKEDPESTTWPALFRIIVYAPPSTINKIKTAPFYKGEWDDNTSCKTTTFNPSTKYVYFNIFNYFSLSIIPICTYICIKSSFYYFTVITH